MGTDVKNPPPINPKLARLMGKVTPEPTEGNIDQGESEEDIIYGQEHANIPQVEEQEPTAKAVFLTEEEMEELNQQAVKKVEAEQKESLKSKFLKERVAELRAQYKPGQKIVRVQLDLPGHADRIILDGTHYFHGVIYKVTEDKMRSMMDIQARAWEHENEVGGANRDLYKGRAPVHSVLSPNGQAPVNNRLAPVVKF